MLQLSLSARAECMDDIAVLMTDLLDTPDITRFLYGYSAKCSDFYEGMLELVFQCPDDRRKDMKSTIAQVIAHVQTRAAQMTPSRTASSCALSTSSAEPPQ